MAEPHATFEGEIEYQARLIQLLVRGCLAKAATVDEDGKDILCTVEAGATRR